MTDSADQGAAEDQAKSGLPVPRPAPDAAPARVRPRHPANLSARVSRKARHALPESTGMAAFSSDADARYNDFLPVALQIVRTPPAQRRTLATYLICFMVTLAILWSLFGHLRLFAAASGEVVARGGNQVVEPVEEGIVSSVPVQNGSHVAAGAIVLQLDPATAQASKAIVDAKLATQRAELVRQTTAAAAARQPSVNKDTPIPWPAAIPDEVKTREEAVMRADLAQLAAVLADLDAKLQTQQSSIDKFKASITAQQTLIDSRTKRTAMHETLAQQGWDSRAMVLQALEPLRQDEVKLTFYKGSLAEATAAILVIKDQIAETRGVFVAQSVTAAAAAERQVSELSEQMKRADLKLADLALRAPVSGTVQGLAVTSLGQAVKIGETLMQIVPDAAPLEIKAYVLNTDAGFVRAGQPVTIKIDTFPFTRYGTISGRVLRIGADAITGRYALAQQKDDSFMPSKGTLSSTGAVQQMTDLVFPVTIIPDQTTIRVDGRDAPLAAGMSVVAEIETERQRAINYILYPLTRVFSAGAPHT